MYKNNQIVEKEFDEKFADPKIQGEWNPTISGYLSDARSFLLTLRKEDIEAHCEKVRGMKEKYGSGDEFSDGYNNGISDILSYFESLLSDTGHERE